MSESTFDPTLTDVNRGDSIIIVTSVLLFFGVLVTVMRVGSILWSDLKFKVDDYAFVFALACNVLADAGDLKATHAGLGRHMQFLTPEEEHSFRLWGELALIFAVFADWSVKIAICLFILRIIKGTRHNHIRWATWALLILTSLCNFIACVLWGLQARPLRKMWDTWVPGTIAPSSQLVASVYMITASNAVIDLFYALSPIVFISGLQMSRKKKYLILSLTGCGLLVFIAAMVKVGYGNDFSSKDISWGWVNIFIASSIERQLALIVASLPAFPPLWHHVSPKVKSIGSRYFHSSNKSSASTTSSSENGSVSRAKAWNPKGPQTKVTGGSNVSELEPETWADSATVGGEGKEGSIRKDFADVEKAAAAASSSSDTIDEFDTYGRHPDDLPPCVPTSDHVITVQNEFKVERESPLHSRDGVDDAEAMRQSQRKISEPWRREPPIYH